jgi:type II secretory ATPase GspE/PulE/Tfp pilus assembly ATPase PilB-like protein
MIMGRVIDIFSRQELEENSNGEPDSSECQFIEYDPEMLMAPELFIDLARSNLFDDCWVPLSWDENGVVVLVDDPSDLGKRASIKAALTTDRIIYTIGSKDDIKAFINRSFSQLAIDDFLLKAMSGEEPVEVPKLVDFIIAKAYSHSASDIYFESSAVSGENRVLFRLDGVYQEYMTLAETVAFDIVKWIKSMANLDVKDRELAKVGHLEFKSDDVPVTQITVTTYPIDGLWEDVVLKILTP